MSIDPAMYGVKVKTPAEVAAKIETIDYGPDKIVAEVPYIVRKNEISAFRARIEQGYALELPLNGGLLADIARFEVNLVLQNTAILWLYVRSFYIDREKASPTDRPVAG